MRKHSRWTALGLLAGLVLSGEAFACSISLPSKPFELAAKPDAALLRRAPPPAVKVRVAGIERTSSAMACDYYASVDLDLSWSGSPAPKWDEVGFVVRIVLADGSSPQFGKHVHREAGKAPEMVKVIGGRATLTVWVGDSPPGGALDFDVDLTPVDRAGRQGEATRVHVHSNARPGERFESMLRLDARLLAEGKWGDYTFTHALLKAVKAGTIPYEPCGPYSPYGCGATETALLAQGEMPYAYMANEAPKPWKMACLGVRQSSGRVARVILIDDGFFNSVAAAEWVDTTSANWTRDAAMGCAALTQLAIARETAYADGVKAHIAQSRRLRELREETEAKKN